MNRIKNMSFHGYKIGKFRPIFSFSSTVGRFPVILNACMCVLSRFGCVLFFVTPWNVAHQAPLSTGFSRQEYWSGLPSPPPGNLPDPATEVVSLMSPALSGRFLTTGTTWKVHDT